MTSELYGGLRAIVAECARIEALDPTLTLAQLGERLGVTASTVGRWRKSLEYRQFVDGLRRSTLEAAVEAASLTRVRAMHGVRLAIERHIEILEGMGEEDGIALSVGELATISRELRECYRLLAAQTGLAERHEIEATVHDPADSVRRAIAQLRELSSREILQIAELDVEG